MTLRLNHYGIWKNWYRRFENWNLLRDWKKYYFALSKVSTFKNKCEKLITISYENSKIHAEHLKKEITGKDNIIHQLLLDLQKISTQSTLNLLAEVSVYHQVLASMEYNINLHKRSQNNEPDTKPGNTETRGTIPKKNGHIDNQLKEVRNQHHQK